MHESGCQRMGARLTIALAVAFGVAAPTEFATARTIFEDAVHSGGGESAQRGS